MTSEAKPPKRIPVGAIELQFAGEVIVPKLNDPQFKGLFRRYEALFENLANMDRFERFLNYRFINGLMLTSYAKKTQEKQKKKELFALKNHIYISTANDREFRRKCAFMYLVSKNFRVKEFCKVCVKKNTEAKLDRHSWKFCGKCDVDRSFYNVLSMHHKYSNGSVTLFLSNDLIPQVRGLKLKRRGPLDQFKEEAQFEKYHYNVRNLDAFNIDSVIEMHARVMSVSF